MSRSSTMVLQSPQKTTKIPNPLRQVGLHLSSSFGAAFIASVPGKFEKKNLEGNFFEIGFHRFFFE